MSIVYARHGIGYRCRASGPTENAIGVAHRPRSMVVDIGFKAGGLSDGLSFAAVTEVAVSIDFRWPEARSAQREHRLRALLVEVGSWTGAACRPLLRGFMDEAGFHRRPTSARSFMCLGATS